MATSYTHTIQTTWTGVTGDRLAVSVARTGDAEDNRIVEIPAGAVNQAVAITITLAQLLSLVLLASGATLTIKTNSATSPTDTLTLAPLYPRIWQSNSDWPAVLTGDVATLYVSNASASAAQLDVRVLQNV